jgi:nicotinamidase/pyrazinamidase
MVARKAAFVKTVFFDVDTQYDFMYPAGALYVTAAEKLIPAIKQLNRYAAGQGVLVISSVDAHAENDPEFNHWPPHCVAGTLGQQKAQGTLLDKRVVVPNRPVDLNFEGAQQIILEKQTLDVFQNVNIGNLLGRLNADRFIVYGVVTEYCVRCAASGLLRTGREVVVVTDAVQTLNEPQAREFFSEFRNGGGKLGNVSEVCGQ